MTLNDFLNLLEAPSRWLLTLPPVYGYTATGILLAAALGITGFFLARLRMAPIWALVILVPYINLFALLWLAYRPWKVETLKKLNNSGQN